VRDGAWSFSGSVWRDLDDEVLAEILGLLGEQADVEVDPAEVTVAQRVSQTEASE
jgi:hypothetical protein